MTGTPVDVPVPSSVSRTGSTIGIGLDLNVHSGSPRILKRLPDSRLQVDVVYRKIAQGTGQYGQMRLRGLILVQHHERLVIANAQSTPKAAALPSDGNSKLPHGLFQLSYYVLRFHASKLQTTN